MLIFKRQISQPLSSSFSKYISVKIKKVQRENIIQKSFGRVAWQNILKGGVAKNFGGMVAKYFGRVVWKNILGDGGAKNLGMGCQIILG